MFTGIVQSTSPVAAIERTGAMMRVTLQLDEDARRDLKLGASVAVDGVCLTVAALNDGLCEFDVVAETLSRTTLGQLATGEHVNVERSMRVGDEVGGHLVSGHVITTATIEAIERELGNTTLDLTLDPEWMRFILPKGFIAINGCSLTVGETNRTGFRLHLIPETLARTTFERKRIGDRVNVELDAMTVAVVQTTERVLAARENLKVRG